MPAVLELFFAGYNRGMNTPEPSRPTLHFLRRTAVLAAIGFALFLLFAGIVLAPVVLQQIRERQKRAEVQANLQKLSDALQKAKISSAEKTPDADGADAP
jgi:hypothetical protein